MLISIGFSGHRDGITDPHILKMLAKKYPDSVWIEGEAEGFDRQVRKVAEECDIPVLKIFPQYDNFPPKYAPLERNKLIVERSDIMVICYDEVRKVGGTYFTLNYARQRGRKIIFVPYYKILTKKEINATSV